MTSETNITFLLNQIDYAASSIRLEFDGDELVGAQIRLSGKVHMEQTDSSDYRPTETVKRDMDGSLSVTLVR
ncbi:MAG: hypothetical protein IKD69_11445 [Solobacterium sp.]|nr:hypothetical protein [Solobacterium sp.]